MRTVIAGSRHCTDPIWLDAALAACGWVPSTVLCGMAAGADALGSRWAIAAHVPVKYFPEGGGVEGGGVVGWSVTCRRRWPPMPKHSSRYGMA